MSHQLEGIEILQCETRTRQILAEYLDSSQITGLVNYQGCWFYLLTPWVVHYLRTITVIEPELDQSRQLWKWFSEQNPRSAQENEMLQVKYLSKEKVEISTDTMELTVEVIQGKTVIYLTEKRMLRAKQEEISDA